MHLWRLSLIEIKDFAHFLKKLNYFFWFCQFCMNSFSDISPTEYNPGLLFQVSNPYAVKLSILDNELALNVSFPLHLFAKRSVYTVNTTRRLILELNYSLIFNSVSLHLKEFSECETTVSFYRSLQNKTQPDEYRA